MYPAGNLFIPAPHGQLEGILKEPRDKSNIRGVALVLHPHPMHGGTMHNKVVFRAAAALNDAGLVSLRINFRGIGQSTGTHDEGRGEKEDVQTALDYLTEHYPGQEVTLAGFSFGSRVGLEVGISDARVARLIGLGVPVTLYDVSFIQSCRKPILFVHGDHDEFGNVEDLKTLISKIPDETLVQLVVVKDADHFFAGHLDELDFSLQNRLNTNMNIGDDLPRQLEI